MLEIPLPEMSRAEAIRGVIVSGHDVAGALLFSVTTHVGLGRAPRRRWFVDRCIALAHSADQADGLCLPIIDLGAPDGEV